MARSISADMLSGAISEMLQSYSDDVKKGVSKLTGEVAKECVAELTRTSPSRTGDYAKGWKRSMTARGWVVHNKKYRLTHLLEYPHANRDGTVTAGRAHIRPAADNAADTLLKGAKEVARG